VLSKTNLKTGRWYHLVATWSTNESSRYIRLYINGKLDKSGTPSVTAYRTNDSALLIGSQLPELYNSQSGYFGFDGKIAGVNVYSESKDEAWVMEEYNADRVKTAYW